MAESTPIANSKYIKPVTEIACLRILQQDQEQQSSSTGSQSQNSRIPHSLLADLSKANKTLTASSSYQFNIYSCIEDPSLLYILGQWPSITFHRNDFIPSQANQSLLALLQNRIDVEFMFHLDITHGSFDHIPSLPRDKTISIARHFISSEQKRNDFQTCFDRVVDGLEKAADGVVAGVRIRESELEGVGNDEAKLGRKSEEEVVVFSVWGGVEEHQGFGRSQGFEKYARIKDFVDLGFEIRHVERIEFGSFD